jgi:hypothetical protein
VFLTNSNVYWLLNDVLHFVILTSLRLKEKNQVLFSFESLMHDDSLIVDELVLQASKVRREVCGVLNFFLLFLIKYENKKNP